MYWHLLGKGDSNLVDLYYTLDNMKCRTSVGLGLKQRASVVTKECEEKM